MHSLHAYFLRPGDPRIPIIYDVDRIRDGRSFTTRRVVAIQHGRAIFNLSASFHVAEDGPEHQYPMPDAPDPETLPTMRERLEPYADQFPARVRRLDPARTADRHAFGASCRAGSIPMPSAREPEQLVWFRANGTLPDDALLHACIVAYASDLTLLDTAVMAHANSWDDDRFMIASLDHAMWFHRPLHADEWLLYHQKSPSAQGARGLAEGFIFRQDGATRRNRDPRRPDPPACTRQQTCMSAHDRAEIRHGHDADAGDAAGDGGCRGGRRRVRRGPDRQPAAIARGRAARQRRPRSTCRRARWRTSSRSACSPARHRGAVPGPRSHVYQYEVAASPQNSGVQMHPLWDVPDGIAAALEGVDARIPADLACSRSRTRTWRCRAHRPTSRRCERSCGLGHDGGLRVHIDGARIWNAAIAHGFVAART